MFENRTPTVVEGLTRDVLGHELGVPSYQTATFEENQQYYSPAEHASGVPVGKERAEDHNQGGRVAGGGR
jgi:hypothetical protein